MLDTIVAATPAMTKSGTAASKMVRVLKSSLSELPDGQIVLRGQLDLATLTNLHADINPYQRAVNEGQKTERLRKHIATGKFLPGVMLGVRDSEDFDSVGDDIIIAGAVKIIDGLQRISALRYCCEHIIPFDYNLGCEVRFGTTFDSERDLFQQMNTLGTRVSPNVLLRNMVGADNRALTQLYALCQNDPEFPLHRRVTWKQSRDSGDLTGASTLLKIATHLHAHKVPGRHGSLDMGSNGLLRVEQIVGLSLLRANIKTFFSVIDQCWGLRAIQRTAGVPQIRHTFLLALADLFAEHANFWKGADRKQLFLDARMRSKLKLFKLSDPAVSDLCRSAGMAGARLFELLKRHLDSGKREHKLISQPIASERG